MGDYTSREFCDCKSVTDCCFHVESGLQHEAVYDYGSDSSCAHCGQGCEVSCGWLHCCDCD